MGICINIEIKDKLTALLWRIYYKSYKDRYDIKQLVLGIAPTEGTNIDSYKIPVFMRLCKKSKGKILAVF